MKRLKKFFILLAVFVGAVLVFSVITNHESKDLTTDMSEATLPVIYLQESGQPVNELHGYVSEMSETSMRGTITPLDEDGTLPVVMDTYGKSVKELDFEIRSLDTERLVQDGAITDFTASGDNVITASLEIENLLIESQEYQLKLTLKYGDSACYYYTRIIKEPDSHISECLSFVNEFHAITMDKDKMDELSSYMEPSWQTSNTNLHFTDITGSLSQACWSEMECTEETTPIAEITELNDEYNVILLNYIASAPDDNGETDYYNVEEYYRVKYGTEKMYLLSFERTVEQIFNVDGVQDKQQYIDLGIRSADVDFKSNETGQIICFVQQGELWSYNMSDEKLTRVFSFRDDSDTDVRDNYNEHDIKIIRAEEGGSVDFVVYGYMNRGDHEGQVGILVCYYDCVTNTVEEEVFIPSNVSYQMLKEQMGEVMYTSDSGMFYFTMGNQVHQVNLETLEDKILIDELIPGTYQCSDNGRYIAWLDSPVGETSVMHLTDLESAGTYDVTAEGGNAILPLGFSETDCIYGIANSSYVMENANGVNGLACTQVQIIDSTSENHDVIKTYDTNGYYVTSVEVDEGSIYLNRVTWNGSTFTETTQDTIRNRDMQDTAIVYVSTSYSDLKETEVVLKMSSGKIDGTPKSLEPKWIVKETDNVVDIGEVSGTYTYYVYAKGKICLACDDISEAVSSADENRGVVVDEKQAYIWKRGKKSSQTALEIPEVSGSTASAMALNTILSYAGANADVDSLLKQGRTPLAILSDAITDGQVYDLTGCDVTEVLYYVGKGIPVYAVNEEGVSVLIIGYDSNYVWEYDFSTGERTQRLISAASEQFANAGNVFYAVDMNE